MAKMKSPEELRQEAELEKIQKEKRKEDIVALFGDKVGLAVFAYLYEENARGEKTKHEQNLDVLAEALARLAAGGTEEQLTLVIKVIFWIQEKQARSLQNQINDIHSRAPYIGY